MKLSQEEIEELIKDIREEEIFLSNISYEIKEEYPEICLEAVKKHAFELEEVPEEVKKNNPEICLEAVERDADALEYVPEEVKKNNPEICLEAVKKDGYALGYVPEEVKKNNPEICLEAVKENGYALMNVPEEVKKSNPEICFEAVKEEARALEYVPEEVKKNNPEMCLEAVERDAEALEYVPEEVKKNNPEMCLEAVERDAEALKYVPEEVKKNNPEICLEAVKKYWYALIDVPEEVKKSNPEICFEAVKEKAKALEYVPEEVKKNNPEMCLEAVERDAEALKYVPEEVKKNNPEMCLEALERDAEALLKYVPEEVKKNNPEICLEAVKKDGYALGYVPEEVKKNNPEICLEAVKEEARALGYVPEEVKKNNPEMCLKAVERDAEALKYVPEEVKKNNPEICLEALNRNLRIYLQEYLRVDTKEIKEFMFEDVNRIEKIKAKSNLKLSPNYRERVMDMLYHNMIKSIGIDQTEELIDIPNFSEEEIRRYNLEYNQKFNQIYDTTYSIKGDVGAVIELFRSMDFSACSQKGKDIRFEIYKNINLDLDENKENAFEYLKSCISKAGVSYNENFENKLNSNLKRISSILLDEELEKNNIFIEERLTELLTQTNHTNQTAPITAIIKDCIKKEAISGYGKVNNEQLINRIEEELARKKENGIDNFYSPHIISQKDIILEVAQDCTKHMSNKDICEILKETRDKTGKGWIRKIIDVPRKLTKENINCLEEKLGYQLNTQRTALLKENISKEEAYKMLDEIEAYHLMTYEKAELMFDGIRKPYSEEFKNYFKKNKDEILQNSEIYTNFSSIHNSFESIIGRPEIVNQYAAGKVTPKDLLRIISEQKYENVKLGNEKLAEVASKANLEAEYFEQAQELFDITRNRKELAIPQVFTNSPDGKYRARMLRADDPLNLFVGNITNCCQRFGGVGEGSMRHASTSKNGGVFLVEEIDKDGKVIKPVAQSWTWRNKDKICFDNIELVKTIDFELEEKKQILETYKLAGQKMIESDEKMMKKIAKEKNIKISDHVVKEVTVGTGYNPLVNDFSYELERSNIAEPPPDIIGAWLDSEEEQYSIAKMSEEKLKELIDFDDRNKKYKNTENVDINYQNTRVVNEYKGRELTITDVEKIKNTENIVYRDEQKVLQNCESVYDIANIYDMDIDKMEIAMSEDGDWYMISEEREDELYIADLAMIGGANSQKNQEVDTNTKIATFEVAEKVYSKMLEMAKKNKKVRYEATHDTSYINTKNMEEDGLITIDEDYSTNFEDTDIEMNDVVVTPNEKELEEKLKEIREVLEKLRERDITRVKSSRKKEVKDGDCIQ